MPNPNPALNAVVARCRASLDQRYQPIGQVRADFDAACDALEPPPTHAARAQAWRDVVGKPEAPVLRAVQPVARSAGAGQVSLYQGDVFALQADQWLCSAFQDTVSPSGGVWKAFWRSAARNGGSWSEHSPGGLVAVDPDRQVATLQRNPRAAGGLPTIVLFGRGSRRERSAHGAPDWPERVYFDGLQTARALAREGRLGRRIAMPVLFSELHGVPYEAAIAQQRAFALDLVRQQEGVREVQISVLGAPRADRLLAAWHLASGDQHATPRDAIAPWVANSVASLQAELRGSLSPDLPPWLCTALGEVLARLDEEPVYLNDVAVLARNVAERWAAARCARAGMKPNTSLASMVSQLRGKAGTPHRTLLYIDAIRELGNVGAHFQRAPHPLEPADLVTLLLGLQGVARLERELRG